MYNGPISGVIYISIESVIHIDRVRYTYRSSPLYISGGVMHIVIHINFRREYSNYEPLPLFEWDLLRWRLPRRRARASKVERSKKWFSAALYQIFTRWQTSTPCTNKSGTEKIGASPFHYRSFLLRKSLPTVAALPTTASGGTASQTILLS